MLDERAYLKVKIKSLAEEAKIIRKETKKARSPSIKNGLYLHRIGVVRHEARHTLLAYGFLRGKTYEQLEPGCTKWVDWPKVRKMVEKYGVHSSWEDYWENKSDSTYHDYISSKDDAKDKLLKLFHQWVEVIKSTKVEK